MTATFLLASALLFLNARHYLPFVSDDALISLRYAERLLNGNGLTWTPGERVEGYSNLLWILAVSAVGLFGVDLILAARALGVTCTATIMLVLACWYARRSSLSTAWFPIAIALFFIALAAPIGVWAIGGLEQPLFAALLAISIPIGFEIIGPRRSGSLAVALGTVLGLMSLTRPDGPLFAVTSAGALTIVGVLSTRPQIIRDGAVVLAITSVFCGCQLAFRIAYYGEFVPNTALVKLTPSRVHWVNGWNYLSSGVLALQPYSFLAIASLTILLLVKSHRSQAVYLLLPTATWAAYVVFIGGDIFPAYRHIVPLIVLFAFSLSEAAVLGVSRLPNRLAVVVMAIVGMSMFVPFSSAQRRDSQSQRAVRERWEWECKDLALHLKKAFDDRRPLMAVTAAGCLPYWTQFPSVDMLGLNDHYLPRHPPPDMGQGFLGHELGDGEYILSRRPDLIVFNVGSGPHFRSGEELSRLPQFQNEFVPVRFSVPALAYTPLLYVNTRSAKPGMGIVRFGSHISIPGFLFTGDDAFAALNHRSQIAAFITRDSPVTVTFELPGSITGWTIDVRGSSPREVKGTLKQVGARVTVTLISGAGETVSIEEVVLRAV